MRVLGDWVIVTIPQKADNGTALFASTESTNNMGIIKDIGFYAREELAASSDVEDVIGRKCHFGDDRHRITLDSEEVNVMKLSNIFCIV